jgi:hypothetical protein
MQIMVFSRWQLARMLGICGLISLFTVHPNLQAQTHVVTKADLHKELVSSTQIRQKNLEKATQLFSSDVARKALKSAQMDPARVKAAVSTLSDSELAQLASRADKLQHDFAAGQLSNRDLLLIVVGLAIVILIIVAVR